MSLKLSSLGARQTSSAITHLMTVALERKDLLSLAAGFTDDSSLPLSDVKEIVASFPSEGDKTMLQYGTNQGRIPLRQLLKGRIEAYDDSRGSLDLEQMFVTNGSQQMLYLAIQTLCDPGDYVLIEQPTYFVFMEILNGLGVNAVAMPMQDNGDVDPDGLRSLLDDMKADGRFAKLKALYLVSYFANPTGHSISEKVKRGLGAVISEVAPNVAIIEDAAYRELYYHSEHPAKSCLALEEFNGLARIYSGTLTKNYATGLKVGYGYCTEKSWLETMLNVKGQQDFGTAHFNQKVLEVAIDTGRYDRQLKKLRGIYQQKMRTLQDAIREPLNSLGWTWREPLGGLYFWLQSPDGLDTGSDEAFCQTCLDKGVFYVPGAICHGGVEVNDRIRLSFGTLSTEKLKEAGNRFVSAAEAMSQTSVANP